MIRQGRVLVDGAPAHIGQTVDPLEVSVTIDGIPLPVRPDLEYHVLYKPVGVVSTAADTHRRPIVVDLVDSPVRLVPAGRLDTDSEGLLILTNDGDLIHRITHPRFGLPKRYSALVEGRVSDEAIRRLVAGVDLDDGLAAAQNARLIDAIGHESLIEIVLTEGRNREVRRMCDAIGHPVIRLIRTAIGPVNDRRLQPGESRPLTQSEVRSLYEDTGAAWQDDAPESE